MYKYLCQIPFAVISYLYIVFWDPDS